MKKSQIEILGLAVIVVIIFLVLFFYAYATATKKPTKIATMQLRGQLTTNTLSALMRVSINCDLVAPSCPANNKIQIDELVKNCQRYNNCQEIGNIINNYLSYTLDNKNMKYKFVGKDSGNTLFQTESNNFNCQAFESGTQIIPPGIEVRLDIC